MPRVLDIDAARELRGLIAELRDEMLSDVLTGKPFGPREIARVQRTLEILNSGDFSAQMAETYSKYQGWAFDEGVAQIDGMLSGLNVADVFNLPPSVFDAAAASYPSKVVTIVPQLHDELSRVLRLGMTGMRTPEQVKADIQRRFQVAASRAQTIATTEIKGMQNVAQESRITEAFRAAGENGVPMVKTWIHSSGQRVGFLKTAKRIGYQPRPHHKAMHGVTVKQGELFTLTAPSGVYMITGPHDEPLPAEEVVSCHCGRGIEIDREKYKVRTAPVAEPPKAEPPPPVPKKAAAPRQPRAPKPPKAEPETIALGTPVGESLVLPGGKTGKLGASVLEMIGRIHGDGNLTKIPLTSSRTKQYHGAFYHSGGGVRNTPTKIAISSHTSHPEFTLCHEIGHWLDMDGIGTKGSWASGSEDLKALRTALDESEAVKKLKGFRGQKETVMMVGDREVNYRVDQNFVRYLNEEHEVFARAYSQYIAIESGSPKLIEQLNTIRARAGRTSPYPMQWDDDDFKAVKTEFDNLFEKLKWRKATNKTK